MHHVMPRFPFAIGGRPIDVKSTHAEERNKAKELKQVSIPSRQAHTAWLPRKPTTHVDDNMVTVRPIKPGLVRYHFESPRFPRHA